MEQSEISVKRELKNSSSPSFEAMQESEIRYQHLFDNTQDGILILDTDSGQVMDVNPFLLRMLGYTRRDFIGKQLCEIGPFNDEKTIQATKHELNRKEYILFDDLPLKMKDGRRLDVEFVSFVYQINRKRVTQCSIRDITKWKQTEEDLRKTRKKLSRTAELAALQADISSRRQSENDLNIKLEDQRRMATVVSDSNDAVIMHDFEGKILAWNRGARETYGYTESEALRKNVRDIVAEPDREAALNLIQRIMQGEIVKSFELRRITKDGRILDIWLTTTLLTDENGKPVAIATTERDITARNQAEAVLKSKMEDLRRLATVVSDSNDAVILHDLEGKILAWNLGARDTYGYTEAEALGKNVRDIVAEPDREAALNLIQRIVQGEIVKSFELRRITKDGRILDVWLTTTLLADENGKPVAIATTERDITARKQAEAALHEKLEDLRRLATVVSDSNDAVIMHDFEGKILAWNRGAKETYGYTEAEALQKNVREIVAEPDREAALNLIQRITQGEVVKSFELRRVTKDGRILDVWLTTTLLTDATGKPIAIATTERDITARKQAEAGRLAREAAEAANAAKSEFLSHMSHELRTPMNSILGFAQLLEISRKEPLTPRQHESVQQILKGGQMLLEIINEVLDLARIESGRMTISPEPVEVQVVMQEALDLVKPLAITRQISTSIQHTPPNQFVKADRQRIKQVILNFLSNAVKYNREGGTVILECENRPDGWLRVSVKDSGNGIPENRMDQLFKPFERVGVKEGMIEGTGLGLALSKRLVELMGGRIGVDSVVGEGSTFWFDLPLTESPSALATNELDESQNVSHTTHLCKLLYIEDNLANFELVKQVLAEQPQIELLWAIQGDIGLGLAEQHHPDLIVLDLHLPDMPGVEVLQNLQANETTKDIPVIILSADATIGQIERLKMTGASAYLTKPLDVKKFLLTVDEFLK
jgi:PAS domain S-box-containing protein